MSPRLLHAPARTDTSAEPSVIEGLESVLRDPELSWLPEIRLEGQLLRPLIATLGGDAGQDAAFWRAALAIQLAHEASLLHDDIVDGAATRRGKPTLSAARGVPIALVRGDHLLTSAYRLAAETGSAEFMRLFTRAIERTVAGELQQASLAGRPVARDTYREIVLGKSGELMGLALATRSSTLQLGDSDRVFELGRRVGLVYQMVDDLLDYCPSAGTGKPAFSDFSQRKWTWVLDGLPASILDATEEELKAQLLGGRIEYCLVELKDEVGATLREARFVLPDSAPLAALLEEWHGRAAAVVERETRSRDGVTGLRQGPEPRLEDFLPDLAQSDGVISRNSRSFRLASRFFPAHDRERVERLYAFCRISDDLGDRHPSLARSDRTRLLDRWLLLSRRAYHGAPSGIALLDQLMGETAGEGIAFRYAEELVEGIRMDLDDVSYRTFADLDLYCYRVASVVGQWMTEFAGVRDPQVLAAAADLGRAMQLTNIARDVGEDLGMGRLYLPQEALEAAGLSRRDLEEMRSGAPLSQSYQRLVEDLLQRAETLYQRSMPWIGYLPPTYRVPVSIAAFVYRGIHGSIRANGYDNLTRRAYTTPRTKARLSLAGLLHATRVSVSRPATPLASPAHS